MSNPLSCSKAYLRMNLQACTDRPFPPMIFDILETLLKVRGLTMYTYTVPDPAGCFHKGPKKP